MNETNDKLEECKVYDNKAILFMLNNSNFTDEIINDSARLGRSNYISSEDPYGSICPNSLDDTRYIIEYVDQLKEKDIKKYEETPLLIETRCMSLIDFSLRTRLGFKLYLGRWYCDESDFSDEDINKVFHLSVLEIKPHMKETNKDLRICHNLQRLIVGHHFDHSLFYNKDDTYLNELKSLYDVCSKNKNTQEFYDIFRSILHVSVMLENTISVVNNSENNHRYHRKDICLDTVQVVDPAITGSREPFKYGRFMLNV